MQVLLCPLTSLLYGSVGSQSAVACKRARWACSHADGSLALGFAYAGSPEGAYPLSAPFMELKKPAKMMPDFLLSPALYRSIANTLQHHRSANAA